MKTLKTKKPQYMVVCRIGTPQRLWLLRPFAHIFATFFVLLFPAIKIGAHPGSHDAMNRVDKRLEIAPNSPEILMERAFLYFKTGHFEEAQRDIDQIHGIEENWAGLDEFQAKLFMGRGEYAAAEVLFVSLLLKKPEDKNLLFSYSEALLAQQKWADAEKMVEHWLQAKGETRPEQVLSLLVDLRNTGTEGALAAYNLLDKTIENIGKLPVLYDTKAAWLSMDGKAAEALVVLDDLHQRFPGNLDYAYRRGWLLEQLGRKSEAHKMYKAAILRYRLLPASRRNAPGRMEMMEKLQVAFERTLDHDT